MQKQGLIATKSYIAISNALIRLELLTGWFMVCLYAFVRLNESKSLKPYEMLQKGFCKLTLYTDVAGRDSTINLKPGSATGNSQLKQ